MGIMTIDRLRIFGFLVLLATGVFPAQIDGASPAVSGAESCEKICSVSAEVTGQAAEESGEPDVRQGVPPEILAALDKLEKLGETLKDLRAELLLEKLDTQVNDTTIKEGLLYYQKDKDQIRLRVSFDKTRYEDHAIKDPEHFVFAEGWLIHRQERAQQEDHYQYLRPGQPSTNLMRIGRSPLPIPIGQKTEEVLENFEVSLIEPDEKTDPIWVKTVHLRLIPREGTEVALSYTRLEFWLAEPMGLPVKSQWENDSADISTAELKQVRVNKGLSKKVFALPKVSYKPDVHPLPDEPEEKPVKNYQGD